ncbi:hypothetical protein MNBD_GAMMA03-168 [hydrothermal vent metagenome]|uniref:Uncharacterized protein n=1 Tax=hydrothermal vent metagenome TaxID=652676 RepID=A0A3B0VXJ9_9ZZZZ
MASNNVDGENNAQPGDDQTTASDIYDIAINSYNVYKGVMQDVGGTG